MKQKSKKAFITGITGQDGSYLAKLLIEKGYIVYGGYRRLSTNNFWRLEELGILDNPSLSLVEFDLIDQGNVINIINRIRPQEIYNLAAQSFVGVSFEQPCLTASVSGVGVLKLLEAIRIVDKSIRFYQASTSEMFGLVQQVPQSEETPFYPRSPYGIAKLYAHWITVNYRESYGIFAASGILFNHESPLRGTEFVTRKITNSIAQILAGKIDFFELGNLDAMRDWGYAGDYVEGMWQMLQAQKPDTYVLATNKTVSVREFLKLCFAEVGMNVQFEGAGEDERVFDLKRNRPIIKINSKYYRPSEVDLLIGNYDKANKHLGWKPKTSLEQLVKMMLDSDLKRQGVK